MNGHRQEDRKLSGFQIMKRLIVELKPLIGVMIITIVMGVLGYLAAIAMPTFGAIGIGVISNSLSIMSFRVVVITMVICAVMRGLLRYCEQLSGHYIAFKILVILRDKVFAALRRLAPAKLDGKEKGNLISLITSDIELLEVFYAHTIGPITIALITNTIVSVVLFKINPWFGIVGGIFFIIVGFFIPYLSSSMAKEAGAKYRKDFGESNSYILDSLRGLKEILLFNNGEERVNRIHENSIKLNKSLHKIKKHEGIIRAITDITIMIAVLVFTVLGFSLYSIGSIEFIEMILALAIISSSFGPVVALSNLSNNLLHTFACAERIFNILDEKPQVEEIEGECSIKGDFIDYDGVTFSYQGREKKIFDDTSIEIKKGEKIALIGESGIGKSTFIKLIMRFWDVNKGFIKLDGRNIKTIPTKAIRASQTLVSQETYLFNKSIEDNIKIGNSLATRDQVIEAAKRASIHNFIETLPKGYDTKVGELGGNISSGEKQRIGLARAFISNGEVLILDEPTSNLDTLNEGEILKAIKENCEDKTILLISHRKSTTTICNKVYKLENKQLIS